MLFIWFHFIFDLSQTSYFIHIHFDIVCYFICCCFGFFYFAGMPIITGKQLIEDKEYITLSLRFHSSIAFTQVNWYTDDTRVRTHKLYNLSITNITVYLLCYGVKVLIQGSRADLTLHVTSQMTFNKISCQIQNAYGSAESSFSYDDIQKKFHPRSKITFVSLPKVFTTEQRQINVSDIPILEGQG